MNFPEDHHVHALFVVCVALTVMFLLLDLMRLFE